MSQREQRGRRGGGGGGGAGREEPGRRRPKAPPPEPIRIAARRPNSPLLSRPPGRKLAASASPRPLESRADEGVTAAAEALPAEAPAPSVPPPERRRAARIVQASERPVDDGEQKRQRTLERLRLADGRSAVTRAADAVFAAGIELPEDQETQLQMLEHLDERRVLTALAVLGRLCAEEPARKRPVLEQRLRRIEEYAEEAATRDAAALLRRSLR